MTVLGGACNAEIFGVHPNTFSPAHSGVSLANSTQTRTGWREGSDSHLALWNNQLEDNITWRFNDFGVFNPEIWVIVDSSSVIQVAWEGEAPVDEYKTSLNPIVLQDNAGNSIVPTGGAAIEVVFPGYSFDSSSPSVLDQIESLAQSASEPSWITGTPFEGKASGKLLNGLWQRLCRLRNMSIFENIEKLHKASITQEARQTYDLLWLRAASMIIHDHRGETCLPLIKNHWSVDGTTGVVTYTA